MELAQGCIQWRALVLAVINLQDQLPDCHLANAKINRISTISIRGVLLKIGTLHYTGSLVSHVDSTGDYLKSMICWVVTPCSSVEARRRFRGTYRRHLEGGGVSQPRNRQYGVRNNSKYCSLHNEMCPTLAYVH
jgi:hypothetical protein